MFTMNKYQISNAAKSPQLVLKQHERAVSVAIGKSGLSVRFITSYAILSSDPFKIVK